MTFVPYQSLLIPSKIRFCSLLVVEDNLSLFSVFVEAALSSTALFTISVESAVIFSRSFSSFPKTLLINSASKLLLTVKFKFFPILRSKTIAITLITDILIIFFIFNKLTFFLIEYIKPSYHAPTNITMIFSEKF